MSALCDLFKLLFWQKKQKSHNSIYTWDFFQGKKYFNFRKINEHSNILMRKMTLLAHLNKKIPIK